MHILVYDGMNVMMMIAQEYILYIINDYLCMRIY
jgi:hypothetical protein